MITVPKFQKKFPKNASRFFDPGFDNNFKQRHPIGYGVLVCCGIAGLVLPLVVLILVTNVFWTAPNSGFLLLAMAGCFLIGIGIFNIVAAFIGQYLGHAVTGGCFVSGGILVAISFIIIYVPDIYALIDEAMVTYYFTSLLFLALPLIFYILFRFAIDSWLRRKGIGKSEIKKLKKGTRNYWWYDAIHKRHNMGMLYHLNKFLTVVYLITLCLLILFGWIRILAPIISGLYAIISLLAATMSLFTSVQDHLDEYGVPLVVLRRSKTKRIDSIFFDIAFAAFPLLVAYAHIKMMIEITVH